MDFASVALLVNAASTLTLTGLIWTVQLVHYPAFRYIAKDQFVAFEAFHQRGIGFFVMPVMLLELGTSLLLLLYRPESLPWWWAIIGFSPVLAIWLSTFLVQVPLHAILAKQYDRPAIEALIRTNWIRTVAWSLRAGWVVGALWIIMQKGGPAL